MKPQEDFNKPKAHFEIHFSFNQSVSADILHDSNSSIKSPFLVNLPILLFNFFLQLHLYQCKTFSLSVAHSKFSSLLSNRIQFLWLTVLLFSGLYKYVRATSLWIVKLLLTLSSYKETCIYHHLFVLPFNHLQELPHVHFPFHGWLHTLPSSVTAYFPSYHIISRIITKLKNRYILKSWKNKMHLLFTQKCIQDFFDRNSIFTSNNLQYA